MTFDPSEFDAPLDRAHEHARRWLVVEAERGVAPLLDVGGVLARLDSTLQDDPRPPADVVDELAAAVEPGLMSMGSGRFFGWVVGGSLPAALGADWLVSAWDQNSPFRGATPGTTAVEDVASRWLLDLLGLPPASGVGFVTGAQMANFTCLAAARHHVLDAVGWDASTLGLAGGPRVTVVTSEERHMTIDLALRYLGLGAPVAVGVDEQGRMRPEALAAALAEVDGPVVVALAAGNLHSGSFDGFEACVDVAHERGAWVHVDGAFGLWAGASPALRHLVRGVDRADSWTTDAHKTLNTPYDCGIAIVRHVAALRSAMGARASYMMDADGHGEPLEAVPEFSRRARGVPVWAALRSLGRQGVADLVDRLALRARQLADGIATVPGARILNDVVFTQVSVAFESDERTREVTQRILDDGVTWMSGSRWLDREVLRVSVSNWSTDEEDVARSVEAVRAAAVPSVAVRRP
jgi:glutamate/tyrosine decarboxylase-like PLP-dependent enzyme